MSFSINVFLSGILTWCQQSKVATCKNNATDKSINHNGEKKQGKESQGTSWNLSVFRKQSRFVNLHSITALYFTDERFFRRSISWWAKDKNFLKTIETLVAAFPLIIKLCKSLWK